MESEFKKYYLILFITCLFACSDQSVELTNEPPTDPNINLNNSLVVAFDTPGYGVIFLYNSLTNSLVNITDGIIDTSYFGHVSSFSEDGNELLFTLDYKIIGKEDWLFAGRDDIFSYNLISGQTARITNTEFRETNPRYSRDKKLIVYQSFEKGYSEIFILELDSNNKNPVFIDQGWDPTFLSNGNQILYTSNPNYNPEFYLFNLIDNTKERIGNVNGTGASISNNGDFFVFAGNEGIYKYDFISKEVSLLSGGNNGMKRSYEPILSSDSKFILYKYFDGSWIYNYLMTSNGKEKIDLGKGSDADFTKDSKYVVLFGSQGIHLIDVYSQKDSTIYPNNYGSFNITVSTVEQ